MQTKIPIHILALSVLCSTSLLAQTATDIQTCTKLKGTVAIAKAEPGKPAAQLQMAGADTLAQCAIGKHGYVIFRYQATDWWDSHEPLVTATAPFSYVANPKKKARFKDRLYAATKRKDLRLTVDGNKADGPTGLQGAGLWRTDKPQTAYWDFKIEDNQEHRLTILTANGAHMTYSIAPLSEPGAKQKLVTLDEASGAAAIQFTIKGNIRLFLEHTAFTPDDLGKGTEKRHRAPANISAIFLD